MKTHTVCILIGVALVGCASSGSARPAYTGPAANLDSGIALYNQAKYAEAEQVFRSLQGNDARAYLAAALARQTKYAEAQPHAEAVLEANAGHSVAVAALGNCLVGLQKYDDAIARLGAVIDANGSIAYAYFWRGQAYQHVKQTERMSADFEAFLRLAPNAPEAASVKQVLSSLRR
jgi:tetratricopeptide (TPR) repeat protein